MSWQAIERSAATQTRQKPCCANRAVPTTKCTDSPGQQVRNQKLTPIRTHPNCGSAVERMLHSFAALLRNITANIATTESREGIREDSRKQQPGGREHAPLAPESVTESAPAACYSFRPLCGNLNNETVESVISRGTRCH